MKASREFYDADADRRRRFDGTDPLIRSRNTRVVELLPRGRRCVDVGCGAGALASLLREKFDVVVGIDLSVELTREARVRGMLTSCADVDDGDLPFQSDSVDAVTCCDVLEHVFDPVAAAMRIRRVLKPGGRVVFSVPNIRYWPRVWSLLRGYFPRTTSDPHGYDGGHLHYFASRNITDVLRAAGFDDIRVYGFNGDPSRRARPVTWALQSGIGSTLAREFGCSTIIAAARRPEGGGA
jgi:SAM-dependent methyltransferase